MELNPDIELIRELKKNGGSDLKKCIQCATCSCVCNLSPRENAFPRKEMLWANWGLKEKLTNDVDLWLCHYCNECSTKCPRGVKPGNVMSALRYSVIEQFAIPKFMAFLYSRPKFLFVLFLFPLILFSTFFISNISGDFSRLHQGRVIFSQFFPHNILEYFWIGGNILIFGLAFISILKFARAIKQSFHAEHQRGLISSAITTLFEILFHKKFSECETNNLKKTGHILVFFGFAGAMMTAFLALIADIVFDVPAPLNFFHPIKIIGNLSGISLFTGCTIFTLIRINNKDGNQNSSYIDWNFLLFLYVIAITGLATQFSRISQIPELAYGVYIVHLSSVFVLLWFIMYSKFAHIIYRTIALIIAKQYVRTERFN